MDVPEPDKQIYQPGEAGTLLVAIPVAGKSGIAHFPYLVQFDDGQPPVKLVAKVHFLPVFIAPDGVTMKWYVGGALESRTLTLRIVGPCTVSTCGVTGGEAFDPSAEVGDDGSFINIQVVPRNLDKPGLTTIFLRTDHPIVSRSETRVYCWVMPVITPASPK